MQPKQTVVTGEGTVLLNDKRVLEKLRTEINNALIQIAINYGLTKLHATRIAYDRDGVSAKITVEAEAKSASGESKFELDFKRYAELYGFKLDDLGREFTASGRRFKLVGFDAKRRAKPIVAIDLANGKQYIFRTDSALRLLGHKVEPSLVDNLVPPPR